MIFGFIFLKMRFRWNHYLSALLVIGGVLIKMSPDLADSNAPVGWIMLFVGSQLFNAGSNTYKEVISYIAHIYPNLSILTKSSNTYYIFIYVRTYIHTYI